MRIFVIVDSIVKDWLIYALTNYFSIAHETYFTRLTIWNLHFLPEYVLYIELDMNEKLWYTVGSIRLDVI